MQRMTLALLGSVLVFSFSALAKKQAAEKVYPVVEVPAPAPMHSLSDQEIADMGKQGLKDAKNRPARMIASTDDHISDECAKFRDALIAAKTGGEFFKVIDDADKAYDQIPDTAMDKKYVVARMATWLPMRGILWRVAPLVHKSFAAQDAAIVQLRNVAEQIEIMAPGSHLDAQFDYLTLPAAELVGKEIGNESQLVAFMAGDVYNSLAKATNRLEKLDLSKPVWFDTKIRFGDTSFGNQAAGSLERYKILDDSTRFAALSRYHKRMAAIAGIAGYNWNGHIAFRNQVSRRMILGVNPVSFAQGLLSGGDQTVFSLESITRKERYDLLRTRPKLYAKGANTNSWMRTAYWHLHKFYVYLDQSWNDMKGDIGKDGRSFQFDPNLIGARKDQVEEGLRNIGALVGSIEKECDKEMTQECLDGKITENSPWETLTGDASGAKYAVSLKHYFYNPPESLQQLFPKKFDEENKPPAEMVGARHANGTTADVYTVEMGGKSVAFRDYRYGRSIGWDVPAYKTLFPELKSPGEVAEMMRDLQETRGTRLVTNGMTLFVR